MDTFRHGQFPLWNPLSFSGTPLLANWQSAPFYPLNILMMVFGNVWGWSLMVMMEPFLAGVFFYLMLRLHGLGKSESLGGGIVFTLSGFMATNPESNTTGQIFMWVPILIILIKKYLLTKKEIYLWFLPWVIFYILSGGFFQPALYALAVGFVYGLWSGINFKKIILYFGLGIIMGSIQLIPTFELLNQSIRYLDPNLANYNFGLMPAKLLLTLLAPDFFGNPVTGNYFGFMGYQETTGYAGMVAVVLALGAIFNKNKRLSKLKITAFVFLVATLVLAFDNPLSRLVYKYRVPLISTGYASRNLLFLSFSMATLTAIGLSDIKNNKKWSILVLGIMGGLVIGYIVSLKLMPPDMTTNYKVTLRNLMIPTGIAGLIYLVFASNFKLKIKLFLLLLVIGGDLLRFTTKFLPFSKAEFADLKIPVMEFLKEHDGDYRIEKDKASLPPNTWMYFGLSSPSGYDPLFSSEYAKLYSVYERGGLNEQMLPRYAETENWDSPLLDLLGVKYVLSTKKDKFGVINKEGSGPGYKFNKDRYTEVFTDNISLALENKTVMPRVKLYTQYDIATGNDAYILLANKYDFWKKIILNKVPDVVSESMTTDMGETKIVSYEPNKVIIRTRVNKKAILFLSDTYYPGWIAKVNGQDTTIYKAFGTLRAVVVPAGESLVEFIYFPNSFVLGAALTLSVIGLLGILRWRLKQNE